MSPLPATTIVLQVILGLGSEGHLQANGEEVLSRWCLVALSRAGLAEKVALMAVSSRARLNFTQSGRSGQEKTIKLAELQNQKLTRNYGIFNFQIIIEPGRGQIEHNGEETFSKWCLGALRAAGLQDRARSLARNRSGLNFVSSSRERRQQLQLYFKCTLPPLTRPFSELKTCEDMRDVWADLWSVIGPKGRKYDVPMPDGWGQEDQVLWNMFKGASYGADITSYLKVHRGLQTSFTQFLRSKVEGIYLHKLGSLQNLQNFNVGWEGIPRVTFLGVTLTKQPTHKLDEKKLFETDNKNEGGIHIEKDTNDDDGNYSIQKENYSSDEDLDKIDHEYINPIDRPLDEVAKPFHVDSPSHLSSLSSLLLHSSSQCDITLVTPSISLQAHKALLLPLLPSLLPLLCSSCSPHDPLVLVLPHSSSSSLTLALKSLYIQGDPAPLARELGLPGEPAEGLEGKLIQNSELEEDPLENMNEMRQENNVKIVKSKTDKDIIVKTRNNENRKVLKPDIVLEKGSIDLKNKKELCFERVSANKYLLSLSEAVNQENLVALTNSQLYLKGRINQHSRGKRFKCKFCDKKFQFKRNLTRHSIVHFNIKPY